MTVSIISWRCNKIYRPMYVYENAPFSEAVCSYKLTFIVARWIFHVVIISFCLQLVSMLMVIQSRFTMRWSWGFCKINQSASVLICIFWIFVGRDSLCLILWHGDAPNSTWADLHIPYPCWCQLCQTLGGVYFTVRSDRGLDEEVEMPGLNFPVAVSKFGIFVSIHVDLIWIDLEHIMFTDQHTKVLRLISSVVHDDVWSLRPCSHHSFGTGTVPERNRAPVFTPVPLRLVIPERADHLAMWSQWNGSGTGPVGSVVWTRDDPFRNRSSCPWHS